MNPTAWVTLALAVTAQSLAGAWAWAWLRPASTWVERSGAGIALGTAATALCGAAFFAATPLAWAIAPLVALGGAVVVRLRCRAWAPLGRSASRAELAGAAVGLLAGAAFLGWSLRSYPLSVTGPVTTYHGDMLFFESIARSLGTLGPSDSILMSGSELRYHWLAYAWAGQLAAVVSAAPFIVMTRVLPVVMLVSVALMAAAWGRRLDRHPLVPTIAALLIVGGGYVGASFGTILNFDSPSQQVTTAWLLAASLALLAAVRRRGVDAVPPLVAFGLLAAACTAGKVSSGAVLLGGAAGVAAVAGFRRQAHARRSLLAFGVGAAASLAAFLAWIAGAGDNGGLAVGFLDKMATVIGLNPASGPAGIALGTAVLVVAVASRWVGFAWRLRAPRTRWSPATVLGAAMGLAGVAALALLGQGVNDAWFALSASAPLSVLSAAGAGAALRASGAVGARPSKAVLALLGTGAAATVAVFALWRLPEDSGRWAAAPAAVLVCAVGGAAFVRSGSMRHRVAIGLTLGLLAAACLARLLPLVGPLVSTREGTRQPSDFSPITSELALGDRQLQVTWGPDEVAAAGWLRRSTTDDDLIATNRTLSALVPALVGRPTYLAGAQYQAPYGPRGALAEVIERDRVLQAFLAQPSPATVAPLCEAGVTWLWIDRSVPPGLPPGGSWEPFASTAGEFGPILLARLQPDTCAVS